MCEALATQSHKLIELNVDILKTRFKHSANNLGCMWKYITVEQQTAVEVGEVEIESLIISAWLSKIKKYKRGNYIDKNAGGIIGFSVKSIVPACLKSQKPKFSAGTFQN